MTTIRYNSIEQFKNVIRRVKEMENYRGKDEQGNPIYVDSVLPIHPNNAHYAVIKTSKAGAVFANEGWDGIALKAGEKYDFSMFSRNANKKSAKILVRLMSK